MLKNRNICGSLKHVCHMMYIVHSPTIKAITTALTNFLLICVVITFDKDKHYRVAVAHSKNICQHIVFN